MKPIVSVNHPLHRLFAGLVEQAFHTEIGVCDPVVTDYLADLLANFVHVDRINFLRRLDSADLERAVRQELSREFSLELSKTRRQRIIHRHIGDCTLFWSGVYPENLTHSRTRHGADHLDAAVTQGKRSYEIVWELSTSGDKPPPALFRYLSENFECCVMGLGLVRKGLERTDKSGPLPGNLLR